MYEPLLWQSHSKPSIHDHIVEFPISSIRNDVCYYKLLVTRAKIQQAKPCVVPSNVMLLQLNKGTTEQHCKHTYA